MGIEWSDELATGVRLIDEQHKEIIYKINSLIEDIRNRKGQRKTRELIDFLLGFLGMHFRTEEDAMSRFQYPGIMDHRDAHQALLSRFHAFLDDYEKNPGPHQTIILTNLLLDLVHKHVRAKDKEMAAFLRSAQENGPAHKINGTDIF